MANFNPTYGLLEHLLAEACCNAIHRHPGFE